MIYLFSTSEQQAVKKSVKTYSMHTVISVFMLLERQRLAVIRGIQNCVNLLQPT
jgi:hypothetical protein